jgi:hypothetical protein
MQSIYGTYGRLMNEWVITRTGSYVNASFGSLCDLALITGYGQFNKVCVIMRGGWLCR